MTSRDRAILWTAGGALAIHFATWIASLEYTSVAVSTLLVATSPLWTTLYDATVRRRRFSPLAPPAFAAAIAGLAMVTSGNRSTPPHPGHELLGAALALAGSAAFAGYLLLVRDVRAHRSTREIVTNTYSVAALALVIAAAVAHQAPPAVHAYGAWGGIVAMAVVSQLLGHTGMNAALRWFSPSAVAFSTLVEPVIAAVLALLIFGERLSPLAALGGCLLLAAIATAIWIDPDQ